MLEIETAIVVINSFQQPKNRTTGAGLWNVYDRLVFIFRDRKDWLGVRTWNDKLEHDADELVRRKVKRVIVICYSWGCGKGLKRFCKRLQDLGVWVDLAILVDPVVYDGFLLGKAANALLPGRAKFNLPDNVHFYCSYRTVNKSKWNQPWGRDVYSEFALPLERTAFGSKERLEKWNPEGDHVVDASVTHNSIDNDARVHDSIVNHVVKFVTEATS